MKIGDFFDNYFHFHKAEKYGIVVLLAWSVAMWLGAWLYEPDPANYDEAKAKYQAEIDGFLAQLPPKPVYDDKKYANNYKKYDDYDDRKQQYYGDKSENKSDTPKNLQKFDPNTADFKTLVGLGIGGKAANSIINYREKGGKFRTATDLQKIYTLSPKSYEEILPYIDIAPQNGYAARTDTTKPARPRTQNMAMATKLVELNTADSTQLTQIKGIGGFFAKNIIAHRNRLGGYQSKTQLLEVYKMDTLKYQEIERYFMANPALIKKIYINEIDAKTLGKHPYVGYTNARNIVAYRTAHGKFNNINDLLKMNGIDGAAIKKAGAYFEY